MASYLKAIIRQAVHSYHDLNSCTVYQINFTVATFQPAETDQWVHVLQPFNIQSRRSSWHVDLYLNPLCQRTTSPDGHAVSHCRSDSSLSQSKRPTPIHIMNIGINIPDRLVILFEQHPAHAGFRAYQTSHRLPIFR